MIKATVISKLILIATLLCFPRILFAQSTQQDGGFETSVAILDTGVLFAIGAREAEQQIRGSFGWPTFQEGFVDGVYFRFDPDGYARFSTSARLDEDVFEVECAPGSTSCIANKNGLRIGLTPAGKVQLQIEAITPNDSFYVSDRKTELPLPPAILEPLDARLETLLASGGELIVKRELEKIQTHSLAGFSAVSTYLRWVAQNQNPRVFPRGWPVPSQSSVQTQIGLTQPNNWETNTTAPQIATTTWSLENQNQRRANNGQALGGIGIAPNQPVGEGFQNQLVQNGALGNTQNLQLQSQIAALQAEIQRLSASNRTNEVQSNDGGLIFAEQARGRNLQLPTGFDPVPNEYSSQQASAIQNAATFNGQASSFGNRESAPNYPTGSAGDVAENAIPDSEIFYHLQKIETMITGLRQDIQKVYTAIQAGKDNGLRLQDARARPDQPNMQGVRLSTPRIQSNLIEPQPASTETLPLVSQEGGGATNEVSLDRDLVESLLEQLNGRTESAVAKTDASAGLNQSSSEVSDLSNVTSASDGYVSLSDYINKVLNQEGLGNVQE